MNLEHNPRSSTNLTSEISIEFTQFREQNGIHSSKIYTGGAMLPFTEEHPEHYRKTLLELHTPTYTGLLRHAGRIKEAVNKRLQTAENIAEHAEWGLEELYRVREELENPDPKQGVEGWKKLRFPLKKASTITNLTGKETFPEHTQRYCAISAVGVAADLAKRNAGEFRADQAYLSANNEAEAAKNAEKAAEWYREVSNILDDIYNHGLSTVPWVKNPARDTPPEDDSLKPYFQPSPETVLFNYIEHLYRQHLFNRETDLPALHTDTTI